VASLVAARTLGALAARALCSRRQSGSHRKAITYRIDFATLLHVGEHLFILRSPMLSRRYRSALSIVCSWRSASRLHCSRDHTQPTVELVFRDDDGRKTRELESYSINIPFQETSTKSTFTTVRKCII
jgi:hypothetical protein